MLSSLLRRHPSAEAVADDLAASLLARLIELQREFGKVEVCLTGGQVANLAYERLARQVTATEMDPGLLELWWTHDALVATDDPRRQSLQALSRLAGSFPLDPARTHPMPSRELTPDPTDAAVSYGREIEGRTIDICLLTLGPQGQVAALYPGHPSAEPTPNLAVGVADAPLPPPEQLSLSLTTINRCREVWLIASGADCADALGRTYAGDPSSLASHVRGVERTLWFVDDAAAGQIPFHHCLL